MRPNRRTWRKDLVRMYRALFDRKDLAQEEKQAAARVFERALHASEVGHQKEALRLLEIALRELLS